MSWKKNRSFYSSFSKERDSVEKTELELNEQLLNNAQQKIKVNSRAVDVDSLKEKKQRNLNSLEEVQVKLSEVELITKKR